jgi:hypothetical protein
MTFYDFLDKHPLQATIYLLVIGGVLLESNVLSKGSRLVEVILLVGSKLIIRPLMFAVGPALFAYAVGGPARTSTGMIGLGLGLLAYHGAFAVKWFLEWKLSRLARNAASTAERPR